MIERHRISIGAIVKNLEGAVSKIEVELAYVKAAIEALSLLSSNGNKGVEVKE